MKKQETFSIRFFVRKSRGVKEGQSPISLRVTVNSERVELSLGKSDLYAIIIHFYVGAMEYTISTKLHPFNLIFLLAIFNS